jgi:hypothetical protein
MVELKKAEKDFQLKMKEYEIDIYALKQKIYKTLEKNLVVIGHQSF